ncbi:MAG: cysteine desulfurase [Treponema sp.]|nr:cysteine desulfurase [Treponema sp.]
MTDISHYFDWAATSPQDEEILQASLLKSLSSWGNPSSSHKIGKQAKDVLEEARRSCAATLNVKEDNIFFTSGGTESDQLALLSVLTKPVKGTILISSIEHPAIREQALILKKCGWNIESLKSDKLGIITPETISEALDKFEDTYLVCVMAVNNETGIIQPVKEIADMITEKTKGKRRPKFHVDCVQAAGKIPFDLNYPGIDSAAFSAHKICGPRGIGILYMKDPQESFLRGGGQEKGIRSGTENVFGAIAFSKVLEKYYITKQNTAAFDHYTQMKQISNEFIKSLSELKGCTIVPEGRIESENSDFFSPYVIQAAFKNIPGQVMLRALDAKNFCISTGSACSNKKANRPVLEAMHIPGDIRETAVRFSFGPLTKPEDVKALLEAVTEINNTFNK